MRYSIIASLFYLSIIVFISYGFGNSIEQKNIPQNSFLVDQDSLLSYYALSKIDSFSIEKRLGFVNKFFKASDALKKDSLIYKALMLKTTLHSKNKELDSAIYYANNLFERSEKNQDSIYMVKALVKLGFYHKRINNYSDAFQNYNDAYGINKLIHDSISAGKNLLAMAIIQKSLGDFPGSKVTAIDGVKLLENTSQLKTLFGLYQNISIAFRAQKNYSEALKYNVKALDIAKRSQDILILKNTKANILSDQKEYTRSLNVLNLLLEDSILKENKREYARVLSNKGHIKWMEDKSNSESESLLHEALVIRTQINDKYGLISSNIHLTEYYLESDKNTALKYANRAYGNAKSINSMDAILEALDYIFKLKQELNQEIDNNLALEYTNTSTRLRDINNRNQEIYAPNRYENEKLIKENAEKDSRLLNERNKKNIFFAIGLLAILGTIFLIFYNRQRNKFVRVEERHLTEKRISKKIHDELGNDIFYLMTQIQNNPSTIGDINSLHVLNGLNDIYSKARDISKEYTDINTGEAYSDELMYLLNSYGNDDTKIVTTQLEQGFWKNVSAHKKKELFRILQELLTNMKKHSEASFVAVTFVRKVNNITINYIDNGVGMKNETLVFRNGLKNVENRINGIKGNFTFDTEDNEGFKFSFTFPS